MTGGARGGAPERLRRPGGQVIPRPATARPGAVPAWAALPASRRRGISLRRVRAALAGHAGWTAGAPETGVPAGGRSAVLVALFEEEGEARVLLTRRSAALRTHTGEVAFPGGRMEAGEGPVAAALREAGEEVGLDPAAVEVVGRLSPLSTASSAAWITPVVGILTGRPVLRPNPAEVERAFDVSLAELASEGVYWEERWRRPSEAERPIHFFSLDGDIAWGATARVLRELLDVVLEGG